MKWLALALLFAAAPAPAHDGGDHGAGWTFDLWVTGPLALGGLVYAVGHARLRRRSKLGRAGLRRDGLLFALGWAILAGALISPLHEAGERSFTMHMIEHELIMLVAALLIAAARPGAVLLWGLPERIGAMAAGAARWPVWSLLAAPVAATALQAAALWAWHVPSLFDLALRNEGWHAVQHVSFVATALLFWHAMIRAAPGIAALCLFATSMAGGALGALMALSASPWYEGYAALGMTPWGLTPAEDQQLAGLLMWVPGGLVHLAAALWFLARWLKAAEGRDGFEA